MNRTSEKLPKNPTPHDTARAQTMTLVATGADIHTILDSLVRTIEAANPAMLCSVLLLDATGTQLLLGAAPSLPDFYNRAIHGVTIGPEVGSCGSAAYFGKRVIAAEIATDPKWVQYRELARHADLAACWSEPILDRAGRVLGTFAIYHRHRNAPTPQDIDVIAEAGQIAAIAIERKQQEAALQESEERFRLALESANMGSWDWDIVKNEVVWSDSLKRLTGVPPESFDGRMETILAMLHPDDRRKAMFAIARSVQHDIPYHIEFRFLRSDGALRWAYSRGSVLRNDQGVPVRMMGVNVDITEHKQAQTALLRSETRFEQLATASPAVIFTAVTNAEGDLWYEYLNPAFEKIHEITVEDALKDASIVYRQIHPDDLIEYDKAVENSMSTLKPFQHSWRIISASGIIRWLQVSCQPEQRENGLVAWHGVGLDVTERKRAEDRFHNLASNIPGLIYQFVLRPDGSQQILYVSSGCRTLLGLESDEIMGDIKAIYRLIHADDIGDIRATIYESATTLQPWRQEFRITTRAGDVRWLQGSSNPQVQANGDIVWDGLLLDITEHKRDQEQIIYNALHDSLTDLPNRLLLERRLDNTIQKVQRNEALRYAVLFLDLDRFKVINDSMGHLAGDELLKSLARRLQTHVHGADLVARLGGDEFVVVLNDISRTEQVLKIAENILTDLQTPFSIHGYEIFVNVSIGIVLGTAAYRNASDLLRDVDIAMYRAKAQGGGTYKIFDANMHTDAVKRLSMETDIRKALENTQFVVYYQPIADLATRRIIGFEALARMTNPNGGLILPKEFIPVAEETGLIVSLDRWMLRTACRQLSEWRNRFAGCWPLKVGINLSARDFRRHGFVEEIDSILAETGLQGSHLTLEITESTLLENINQTIEILCQLKARHVQISIDDFGTGYSSLSYLHRLPADHLKVDRSFVSQMEHGDRNYQVVSTIIALSNQLGLAAVAEGIETDQQLEWLQQLGCEQGQGYLFAKPLPAHEIEARILTKCASKGA